MGAVLEARGLVKSFGDVRAVDGIDLAIGAGERVALLGPNGAGKTTTLLMLLGAITPDEGTISLAGHDLPHGRSAAMAEVGFVAGYLPLPERLRVREALSVFAGLYGLSRRAGDAAVDAGLERFKVGPPRRPHVHGAVVGPADAGGHREGRPPPAVDPRARRAHGQPRPRRRPPSPGRAARHRGERRHRAPRHEPQHARGRAAVRAGGVPGRRPGGADGSPTEVADRFGHGDLEGVFLHLAGTVLAEDQMSTLDDDPEVLG